MQKKCFMLLFLGICFLQASAITVVSNNTNWMQSTVSTVDNTYPGWQGVSSLPGVSTYTIVPTLGGTHVANVSGATNLSSASGIRYYRSTFNLLSFSDITADFQISVDNDVHIFINGHAVALEGSLSGDNFSSLPHHRVFVASNNTVINGYSSGQAFDWVASSFADSNWVVGINEVVLAIRNLDGGDGGGFSFRMDLNVTEIVPESSTFLLFILAGIGFIFTKKRITL